MSKQSTISGFPRDLRYIDLDGCTIYVSEMEWLEDGTDVNGEICARYAIGREESVWLNDAREEVMTD